MHQVETYTTIAIAEQVRSLLDGVSVLGAHLWLKKKPEPAIDLRPDWNRLHQVWKGKSRREVDQHPRVQAYRSFYARMGFDPDRNPPSVQVLVQRFLRGEALTRIPAIHPIVDAVNVAAVETMVPLGVFDAGSVAGDIVIDLSAGGEHFHPIGGQEATSLQPGLVVLRDNEKVLSQFCHRDSEAQKVTESTREVWVLSCQVPGIITEEVANALWWAIELLGRDYMVEPC